MHIVSKFVYNLATLYNQIVMYNQKGTPVLLLKANFTGSMISIFAISVIRFDSIGISIQWIRSACPLVCGDPVATNIIICILHYALLKIFEILKS